MTTARPVNIFTPHEGAHYLHRQTSAKVPRRFVFFDTEAYRDHHAGGEHQRWRLGVTATVTWNDAKHTWTKPKFTRHPTPESLWELVTGFARRSQRTVVVAHKLAYDLRISGGLDYLPQHGWEVHRPMFANNRVSLEARKDEAPLVLVDSLTLIPQGIGAIGVMLGIDKPALPDDDAPQEVWWERCEADVAILCRAYMEIMDWLSRDQLGGWARTGPGIGWHVMLKGHLGTPVLVHNRKEVRDAEKVAMGAGRAEAWQHGTVLGGPFWEWDYELAYANICAETALPTVLVGKVHGASLSGMLAGWPAYAYLVNAEVVTDVPALHWTDDLGTCWPVGRFTGTWWDFELAAAETAGAKVKVKSAWKYKAAPWLSSWASWTMDQVHDLSTPEARVRSAVAKQWSRSVPGRTAMRYRDWQYYGEAYRPGAGYVPAYDVDAKAHGAVLTLGNQRWEAWSTEWSDNALPQVLSSVMAHCRVRLWHAMVTAGFDNLVATRSDSVIVTEAGSERLEEAKADGFLWSLRKKQRVSIEDIQRADYIESNDYRRMAGIPRGAVKVGPLEYEAQVWEGITSSMAAGHPAEVWLHKRRIILTGLDTRRLHLADGKTAPFTVAGGQRAARAEDAS